MNTEYTMFIVSKKINLQGTHMKYNNKSKQRQYAFILKNLLITLQVLQVAGLEGIAGCTIRSVKVGF